MTRSQLLAALMMVAFSTGVMSAPVQTAPVVVKAKKVEKKAVKPAKKDDGKIKPLDPNRKVPTLKKKYKKD